MPRAGARASAAAFSAVPLPDTAVPAKGSDAQLVLVQPDTGKMWEFFKLRKTTTGWHAAWGGWNLSLPTASGVFANSNFGAAGSGLALLGGMPRMWELDAGEINHAVSLSIPQTSKTELAAPAVRTDGTDTLLALMNLELWCRVFLDRRTHADVADEFLEAAA